MILEKKEVFIKSKEGEYWAFSIDHQKDGFWLEHMNAYLLTESQLETLKETIKQEYYAIGVKHGQENK